MMPVGIIFINHPRVHHGHLGTVDDLAFFSIKPAMMAAPFWAEIRKGRLGIISFNGVSIKPGYKIVTSISLPYNSALRASR